MDPEALLAPLVAIEAAFGARVMWRFLRGMTATRIAPAPYMEGLLAQGSEVAEILAMDGGSSNGTQALITRFAARDTHVHLLDASPIPVGWNGKAWRLDYGARRVARYPHQPPGVAVAAGWGAAAGSCA
jgi:hypothetical protein